jgi:hypothetical protein
LLTVIETIGTRDVVQSGISSLDEVSGLPNTVGQRKILGQRRVKLFGGLQESQTQRVIFGNKSRYAVVKVHLK